MKAAVVTGAASGIGRALARELAAEGLRVHLVDVAPTDQLAAELGGQPWRVDVSNPEQMSRLASAVSDVDLICLNAGLVGPSLGPPWEPSPGEWSELLSVNLMGVVNGLRAFVPLLLESGRTSRILITASLAGLLTFPGGGAYAATKHAVVAVAEQAALALIGSNISVTLLCPALVRTAMSDVGDDPADVAAAALAASRQGRFLVAPDEWATAVRRRTERLLAGEVPDIPAPTPSGEGNKQTPED